jgi:hypothetical protein
MYQLKPTDTLEHSLLRPEQSTLQYFLRLIIHKRTIYTVETVEIPGYNGPQTTKPILYEVARQTMNRTLVSLGPLSLTHLLDWVFNSNDVSYINMILQLDDVNSRLPWDFLPFYWTNSKSKLERPAPKLEHKERLRITTSRNSFKPINLNSIQKRTVIDKPMPKIFGRTMIRRFLKYRLVPFLVLKLRIILQAANTVFFVIGLNATLLRLLLEAIREQRVSLDIYDNFGFWAGFGGILYFMRLVIF